MDWVNKWLALWRLWNQLRSQTQHTSILKETSSRRRFLSYSAATCLLFYTSVKFSEIRTTTIHNRKLFQQIFAMPVEIQHILFRHFPVNYGLLLHRLGLRCSSNLFEAFCVQSANFLYSYNVFSSLCVIILWSVDLLHFLYLSVVFLVKSLACMSAVGICCSSIIYQELVLS